MIDHVSIQVSDLEASTRFYDALLESIGLRKLVVRAATVGYGKNYPEFWLNHRPHLPGAPENPGAHVCLRARSRRMVEQFHVTAVASGGQSERRPGDYEGAFTTYFAAFVLDLDGNRIEAANFPS